MKQVDQSMGANLSGKRAEAAVEELLLHVELADDPIERAARQDELDSLVAVDPEAACVYHLHLDLEVQLQMLALESGFPPPARVSPLRRFFRSLRMRFIPGPIG